MNQSKTLNAQRPRPAATTFWNPNGTNSDKGRKDKKRLNRKETVVKNKKSRKSTSPPDHRETNAGTLERNIDMTAEGNSHATTVNDANKQLSSVEGATTIDLTSSDSEEEPDSTTNNNTIELLSDTDDEVIVTEVKAVRSSKQASSYKLPHDATTIDLTSSDSEEGPDTTTTDNVSDTDNEVIVTKVKAVRPSKQASSNKLPHDATTLDNADDGMIVTKVKAGHDRKAGLHQQNNAEALDNSIDIDDINDGDVDNSFGDAHTPEIVQALEEEGTPSEIQALLEGLRTWNQKGWVRDHKYGINLKYAPIISQTIETIGSQNCLQPPLAHGDVLGQIYSSAIQILEGRYPGMLQNFPVTSHHLYAVVSCQRKPCYYAMSPLIVAILAAISNRPYAEVYDMLKPIFTRDHAHCYSKGAFSMRLNNDHKPLPKARKRLNAIINSQEELRGLKDFAIDSGYAGDPMNVVGIFLDKLCNRWGLDKSCHGADKIAVACRIIEGVKWSSENKVRPKIVMYLTRRLDSEDGIINVCLGGAMTRELFIKLVEEGKKETLITLKRKEGDDSVVDFNSSKSHRAAARSEAKRLQQNPNAPLSPEWLLCYNKSLPKLWDGEPFAIASAKAVRHLSKVEERQTLMLSLLGKYKAENGHANVPYKYQVGEEKVGIWLSNLCKKWKKKGLDGDLEDKLLKLGVDFDNYAKYTDDQIFEILRLKDLPECISYKGTSWKKVAAHQDIAHWPSRLRGANKMKNFVCELKRKDPNKYAEICSELNVTPSARHGAYTEDQIRVLLRLMDLPECIGYFKGSTNWKEVAKQQEIALWPSELRDHRKICFFMVRLRHKFPDKYARISNEAKGLHSKPRNLVSLKSRAKFNIMLRRVVEYVEEQGHGWIPKRYEGDRELGNWAQNRRSDRKKGILSNDRIEDLTNAGFIWEKDTDPKFNKYSNDPYLNEHDVLCGRCSSASAYVGNNHLRCVVAEYHLQYLHAKKNEKMDIARAIVARIEKNGGRFLQRSGDTWSTISPERAIAKASQVLRDLKRPKRV